LGLSYEGMRSLQTLDTPNRRLSFSEFESEVEDEAESEPVEIEEVELESSEVSTQTSEADVNFCPYCGVSIEIKDVRFCPNCGSNLDGT